MIKQDYNEIINRLEKLEKAVFSSNNVIKRPVVKIKGIQEDVDFSINERAFVKRYTTDKSGPKKFTLLLTYLAKEEVGKKIELGMIRSHWNKMSSKSMLGKFNMFYPNEAKTRGWVDSKEHGFYELTKEWKAVLQ